MEAAMCGLGSLVLCSYTFPKTAVRERRAAMPGDSHVEALHGAGTGKINIFAAIAGPDSQHQAINSVSCGAEIQESELNLRGKRAGECTGLELRLNQCQSDWPCRSTLGDIHHTDPSSKIAERACTLVTPRVFSRGVYIMRPAAHLAAS
jgi:hypothetical protein